MACIVKKNHLKVLFKEMQFVAFFNFHMEKTRMQVKNDLRCLRQKTVYMYLVLALTHLSLESFLWDIRKQYSPRCDAAERGVPSGAILSA